MFTKQEFLLYLSILFSAIILGVLVFFIYRIIRLYNSKQIEYITNMEYLNLERERDKLIDRVQAQEETFEIIGRDLHDNVNQILTLAKLNLGSLQNATEEEKISKVATAMELVSEAIRSLSSISQSLNPSIVKELGFKQILEREARRIRGIGKTEVILEVSDEADYFEPELTLELFRITQETIRNSLVHGKATKIRIQVAVDDTIQVLIQDNGLGMDQVKLSEKKFSQGLKNIQKRVLHMEGVFDLKSEAQHGVSISIMLPKEKSKASL